MFHIKFTFSHFSFVTQARSKFIAGKGGSVALLHLVCLINFEMPLGLVTLREAILTGLNGARNLVCPPNPS